MSLQIAQLIEASSCLVNETLPRQWVKWPQTTWIKISLVKINNTYPVDHPLNNRGQDVYYIFIVLYISQQIPVLKAILSN